MYHPAQPISGAEIGDWPRETGEPPGLSRRSSGAAAPSLRSDRSGHRARLETAPFYAGCEIIQQATTPMAATTVIVTWAGNS